MRQQDMLHAAMRRTGQTPGQVASALGVPQPALEAWLLSENAADFRRMPDSALRLLASRYGIRKSTGLAQPYDWSNPALGDDALIMAALRCANFPDLVNLCLDHGLEKVNGLVDGALARVSAAERPILARILTRMLRSIEIALSDEEHRSAAGHD